MKFQNVGYQSWTWSLHPQFDIGIIFVVTVKLIFCPQYKFFVKGFDFESSIFQKFEQQLFKSLAPSNQVALRWSNFLGSC